MSNEEQTPPEVSVLKQKDTAALMSNKKQTSPEVSVLKQKDPTANYAINYNLRFIILLVIALLISLFFLYFSFGDSEFCIDTCDINDINSNALFFQIIALITVAPAALIIFVYVKSFFILGKATFKPALKRFFISVLILSMLNTFFIPVGHIRTFINRSNAEKIEKTAKCINSIEMIDFNNRGRTKYYDTIIHNKTITLEDIREIEKDSGSTLESCTKIMEEEDFNELLDFSKNYCIDPPSFINYLDCDLIRGKLSY